MTDIINIVLTKNGYHQLSASEEQNIKVILPHVPAGKFKEFVHAVVNRILDMREYHIRELQTTGDNSNYESHKHIEFNRSLRLNDIFGIERPFNQPYKKMYIVLDNLNGLAIQDSNGLINSYQFNYSNDKSIVLQNEFTTYVPIRNIIAMRIYKPTIPVTLSIFNNRYSSRIGILIEEFSNQAMIMSNNARSHWILRGDTFFAYNFRLDLDIDDFNEGLFTFKEPIRVLSQMTLSLWTPLSRISMEPLFDIATFQILSPANTRLICQTGSLIGGVDVSIQIYNFTTLNPTADAAFIEQINTNDVMVSITGIVLEFPYDFATKCSPINGLQCRIQFIHRRMILPFELTCLTE